ncbi:DUF2690 domain-containing protein [Streptomyces sp. NPDC050636]|uniref:DUF2690 domain-containing protein n=1 Tax=Streptomyces sp. NPDC050636 TaxID=3154510 RepID=UPI003436E18E
MTQGVDEPAHSPANDDPDPTPDPTPAPSPHPDPAPEPDADPAVPQRLRARLRGVGPWLRAHAKHALVVGLVTAVVTGIVPIVFTDFWKGVTEDPPPECPGAGCTGKNPKKEWCAGEATTWQPDGGNPVALQVRYSKRCPAVWGKITQGEPGDTVSVRLDGGAKPTQHNSIDYGPDQFTNMVAVSETFHVRVCATPTTSPKRKGRWVQYCIEATERSDWQ